jgi:hypothetical protein
VTASASYATSEELYWAKNQIAEQTASPGTVRFPRFETYALSNGDRGYCGDMRTDTPPLNRPFYMRSRGRVVKAVATGESSAAFARKTCEKARKGTLQINPL